jgi:hypothetical protein
MVREQRGMPLVTTPRSYSGPEDLTSTLVLVPGGRDLDLTPAARNTIRDGVRRSFSRPTLRQARHPMVQPRRSPTNLQDDTPQRAFPAAPSAIDWGYCGVGVSFVRSLGWIFVFVLLLVGGVATAQDGRGWLGADVVDVTKAEADKFT